MHRSRPRCIGNVGVEKCRSHIEPHRRCTDDAPSMRNDPPTPFPPIPSGMPGRYQGPRHDIHAPLALPSPKRKKKRHEQKLLALRAERPKFVPMALLLVSSSHEG
eukprot:4892409-Pyramimonas_sp.AAC.1